MSGKGMGKPAEFIMALEPAEITDFCGEGDFRIREMEQSLNVRMILRGNEIKVVGDEEDVGKAAGLLNDLLHVHRKGNLEDKITRKRRLQYALRTAGNGQSPDLKSIFLDEIPVPLKRRRVTPLTAGQKRYVDAIRHSDIVFAVGPAGTGKTYLAMAMAVTDLMQGNVRRIILVRPAVEAGEKLGFLPGDLAAKIDPYLRPLWDALYEMMEAEKIKNSIETGVIEIAPLAFMRGRTLNNAFVILDEAQNTTPEQMKMFLTRLGFDSKAIITGDITQIDLPMGRQSGLIHVQTVLKNIEGISFIYFDQQDVVRHELVQKIIRAYEQDEKKHLNQDG
ncbi:MAG TPA: PhoH family protein [Candidatus Sumerlaeota bacterium]|nr:MAG: PhoH-like protein [candidate division BRC1 bacterium ADurb.Bin183]HOE62869.1 PhoH family protein [Candidatus Sumerlaeota bacterium]HRR29782.1 PhoH family protein [Candidatus Sumerlaeia bacterium]HON50219.1 PhoH family protein [Candidatus Sumerlaeota bacterium]HOR63435.1 PhoH family protein [Candidatus Sumerlaeota bacterium]